MTGGDTGRDVSHVALAVERNGNSKSMPEEFTGGADCQFDFEAEEVELLEIRKQSLQDGREKEADQ